jgi:hypothetical protein
MYTQTYGHAHEQPRMLSTRPWTLRQACVPCSPHAGCSNHLIRSICCLPCLALPPHLPFHQVVEMSTTELGNLKYAVASVAGHGSYGE